MPKYTVEDLKEIKSRHADRVNFADKTYLMICGGTGCHATGSLKVKDALNRELAAKQLQDKVEVVETGCNGFCAMGPIMVVKPGDVFYQKIQVEDIPTIVQDHLINGKPVEKLLYKDPLTQKSIAIQTQIPFFAHQMPRALRNKGLINPESIDDYIARDGYLGAARALVEMSGDDIIQQMKASGLRGRGGAGFPTGLKWEFARKSSGSIKYVLCNADEGDPGAFMDRSILEADPHAVLEGMIIAAKAIDAHQGCIYCRAEYPLAIHRLHIAIGQAKQNGLLGPDIMGSGFDFEIEVYRGAGAFVCGEETALMTSIEGKRGTPRPRPPFPAIQGLWKKPTILNNVETFANIPQIILNGGQWYAGIGTMGSKGTKVFALSGNVKNVGLVEVPMGSALGSIIFDVGGGIPKGKKFKAVQLGGPSGGCIPAVHLNASVDYETIAKLGAIVGSGGMIVMDEDKCVVDLARFFMEFCRDESCGKCTPCRVGTQKMLEILTRICDGKGQSGDIDSLFQMAEYMKNNALCGLGQTAPNPVLSTLRYFRHEYEEHIHNKRCPAVVCNAFFTSPCQHACPIGMDIPAYISLIKADRLADAYRVLLRTNPFPGICGRVCDHKCEFKCRRSTLDEPVHIKYLKRYITDHGPMPAIEPAWVARREAMAVIGAGPAGLTAARDLVLRGYRVTVYEELPEAGGMLRWGIPAYRLPRAILKQEIAAILDLGVVLKSNTRVGRDISWDTLRNMYDAVFVAIGAQRSLPSDLDGKELSGITGAVEFLRELNLGGRPNVGRQVAVIGGGNSAIDAAQCALRLGAEKVTLYYRRTQEEMPALKDEVHTALAEGVYLECLVAPIRFVGENSHVTQMILQKMRLGDFDAGGRRKPVPILGSTGPVDVDQVILAIGQQVDGVFEFKKTGIALTKSQLIEIVPGKVSQTTAPMMFAGGDVVTGPDTVVGAIAAGHKAAIEMDAAIRAKNHEPAYEPIHTDQLDIPQEIDSRAQSMARSVMPEVHVADRIADFREVELGFSQEVALKEAGRCLRCDVQEKVI